MARTKGAKSYKNPLLLNLIEAIKPSGQLGWLEVGTRYKAASGEEELRDWQDIRRHFLEKLCDNHRAPTGSSGPANLTRRAQEVYAAIENHNSAGAYGGNSSDSEDSYDEEEEQEEEQEEAPSAASAASSVAAPSAPTTTSVSPRGSLKRAREYEDGHQKSKNSRPNNNPRGSASMAINSLADAMGSAAQMQMMMQMNQQNMQMMMAMMQSVLNTRSPPPMPYQFLPGIGTPGTNSSSSSASGGGFFTSPSGFNANSADNFDNTD